MKTIWYWSLLILVIMCIFLCGCVSDGKFNVAEDDCELDLFANISLAELKAKYKDTLLQIQEELIVEGYVVSSDKEGNFFGTLHIQDLPQNAGEGLQIEIDLRELHLFYPPGTKVLVNCKGLYLGKYRDVYKLGGVFTAFGNRTVGRLPAHLVDQHVFVSCDIPVEITPRSTKIEALTDQMISTMLRLDHLEFIEEEVGLPFSLPQEEVERTLTDCENNTLILLNSGFSSFQENLLPAGNGSIVGILGKVNTRYQLIIRELEDVTFQEPRCEQGNSEIFTDSVFISEIADPDNNAAARFLELYNAGNTVVSLNGWKVVRYTNSNIMAGSTIDLSGYEIPAQSTFVISPNEQEFELVYGFPADFIASTNTAADSNGDDNLVLIDPSDTIKDIFGVIGEDGSGTNHEFEDGRAVRNSDIVQGNAIFNDTEWIIYNDSGGAGTNNQPQLAPDDFNPGSR